MLQPLPPALTLTPSRARTRFLHRPLTARYARSPHGLRREFLASGVVPNPTLVNAEEPLAPWADHGQDSVRLGSSLSEAFCSWGATEADVRQGTCCDHGGGAEHRTARPVAKGSFPICLCAGRPLTSSGTAHTC